MKRKTSSLFLLAAATLVAASSAHAALTWDTGQGDGATITSGNGTWDLSATNWNNGSGNIAWTNGNDAIFTTNNSNTITIGASAISAGEIAVNGISEIVWQGALNNLTFTTVNINTTGAGKLSIKANTASPGNTITGGTINIANGATLYVATNGGSAPSIGSTINVQGTGNNENRGAIRLDNGSTLSGSVNLLGNTTIGGGSGVISGDISGSGFGITTAGTGTGTLTFSGNNTYSGGMTIGAGTIQAGHNNAFGTGALKINGGTLSSNAAAGAGDRTIGNITTIGADIALGNATNTGALNFTNSVGLGATTRTLTVNSGVTFSGAVTGSNGFTKAGTGALTITGSSTYTGTTTITAGTLQAGHNNAFGSGTITLNGGFLNTGGQTLANGISVATAPTTGGIRFGANATLTGAITGASGATLNIAATSASSLYLNGDTSGFNGTMAINNAAGNVTASKSDGTASTNTGGVSTTYTVNSGGTYAFSINRGTFNMGALSGNGKVAAPYNTASTSTVSIGALNTSTAFSGTLANNGSGVLALTKVGNGTVTLSGTNNYTGATTISAGTLAINGNQIAATGAVSVSNAGTRLIGTGTVGGNTTVNTGAIHSAGGAIANESKVGLQTFDQTAAATTNVTYTSGSIFEWDLGTNKSSAGYDHDSNSGTPNTNVGTRGIDFDAVDVSGTLSVASADITGAIFRVVLGSAVTADSFWQQTQTWSNIFGGGGTLSGAGFTNSLLQVVDTNGATFNQNLLNSGYGFTISGTTLTWSAVPEPTSAVAGLLLGAGLLRRRRTPTILRS
ncbi:MAG: autotransporter-associated beta strand repeat-containing protein [Verrucomicrobiota bacterium]